MTDTIAINPYLQQDQQDLLVFRVADSYCCISAASVVSIIEPPAITRLPFSPRSLAGMIDFNNSATPVHCLRTYFDEPVGAGNNNGVIIIVNSGAQLTGFWVDEALDIVDASSADFHEQDPFLADNIVSHIVRHKEQLLLYIDLQTLDKEYNGPCLSRGKKQYPVNTDQDDNVDRSANTVKQEQRVIAPVPNATIIDTGPGIHDTEHKIAVEHPDATIPTNSGSAQIANPSANLDVAGENNCDKKPGARFPADAATPEIPTETPVTVSKSEPTDNRYDFYNWQFTKVESGGETLNNSAQYQSIALKAVALPPLHTKNTPATYTNIESSGQDVQHETTLSSQPPGANIVKRLSPRWKTVLLLLSTLLPVLVWRSLSNDSITEFTPAENTYRKPVQQKQVDDNVTAPKMELAAEEEKTTAGGLKSENDSSNVAMAPAQPSKRPDRYQVILGLKTQTYSITVERPSAKMPEAQTTTPDINHNKKSTVFTDRTQQQQLSNTVSERLSFVEEQPVRSLDHLALHGKTDNWNVAQYDEFIYIVVKGDTLWDIAAKYLGDPFQYKRLSELSYVRDPDWIYPGDIVRIRKVIRPQIPAN
ncbi:MAG: chemotaxis protein CheW [Gammaproteobacteria bacterium]|jgi:chemotaxis signal transduction protein/nucleoid-associated protein YgaU